MHFSYLFSSRLSILLITFLILIQLIFCQKEQYKSTILSFKPGGQYCLLTFENGPHDNYTNELLDVLHKKQSRATFFIKGGKIDRLNSNFNKIKDTLLRILSERHEIAIHGWDNEDNLSYQYNNFSIDKSIEYINKTSNHLIENLNYRPSNIRRPTNTNTMTLDSFNQNMKLHNENIYKLTGYKTILWSIDSNDMTIQSPQIIVSNIIKIVKPGDIINFHENSAHISETISLLIDELNKLGYELLTLSEILSFPDDSPK